LDDGETEPIDVIWARIEDGTSPEYLGGKYGVDTSLLPDSEQTKVLEFFRAMAGVNARAKFGVEHNGIALLIRRVGAHEPRSLTDWELAICIPSTIRRRQVGLPAVLSVMTAGHHAVGLVSSSSSSWCGGSLATVMLLPACQATMSRPADG